MSTKILMFGWEFPPHNSGGLGVACQGIVRSLSKLDTQITFVLPRKVSVTSPFADFAFAEYSAVCEGVEGVAINSSLSPYLTTQSYQPGEDGKAIYGANLIAEVRRYALRAREIMKAREYDVIYAHDWLSFPAGILAKKITGKPLIVHVHSTEFDRCGGPSGVNPEVYQIEWEGMHAADRIVALSQFMKNILVLRYGMPAEKIDIVHNGIDEETTPRTNGGRSQLASLKKAGYSIVLFLGRITLQKGLDHLLRAAARVVKHDPNVLFLVSGSGDMERRMMEYAAELDIARNVLFSGFLRGSEQHEAYLLADLFVMPSVSEPFGIAALEAMKLGTPVLVSNQSGVAEAIQHALKADFWDVDDLANKILAVVAHPTLRSTLSHNGSGEVEYITWDKSATKINQVIHRVAV